MQSSFSGFTYAPKDPRADSFISTILLALSLWPVSSTRCGCSKRASTRSGTRPLTKETSDPGVSHQSPTKSPGSKIELAFINKIFGLIWSHGCLH